MSVVMLILGRMSPEQRSDTYRLAGIVTTADLLARGYSRSRLRLLIRRGDLVPLSRGVYATADLVTRLPIIANGEVLLGAAAALATGGPGSVVSHHSAAQIHGLDLLGRPSPLAAITRPPGVGSRSGKHGLRVHSAALPADHVGGRFGVPVTTAARTVVDLARTSSFREGVVVADSALRQKLTSKKELRAVLAQCQRWPGVALAAQVVEFADGLSESVLESIARVGFSDSRLPRPELQVNISEDEFIGRVDFLWRQYRTIAEVDGAMKYDDRSRAMLQLRRDAKLRDAGYEVVHFNWQEITEKPGQVSASIRAAFARGCRSAARGPLA